MCDCLSVLWSELGAGSENSRLKRVSRSNDPQVFAPRGVGVRQGSNLNTALNEKPADCLESGSFPFPPTFRLEITRIRFGMDLMGKFGAVVDCCQSLRFPGEKGALGNKGQTA